MDLQRQARHCRRAAAIARRGPPLDDAERAEYALRLARQRARDEASSRAASGPQQVSDSPPAAQAIG